MAQIDLGKIKLTDEELSEKIIQTNGGVRLGKDADGKSGYVVTDAETGADTVVPFSSGDGGGGSIKGCIYFSGAKIHTQSTGLTNYFYNLFNESIKISKIKEIKTVSNFTWVTNGYNLASSLGKRMSFFLLLKKEGEDSAFAWENMIGQQSGTRENLVRVDYEQSIILNDFSRQYDELIGVGVSCYIFGGSSSGNFHNTYIGDITKPYDSRVEYTIS